MLVLLLLLVAAVLSFASKSSIRYLEGNSWLFRLNNIGMLLDPVLVSPLDFGVPFLYKGEKKIVDGPAYIKNNDIDYVLITQGFDDHLHLPTIKALMKYNPNLMYITPPSGENMLKSIGVPLNNQIVIKHRETIELNTKNSDEKIKILATEGALLGPPWQAKENGYIISSNAPNPSFPSIYIEPHCMYNENELASQQADYIISPIVAQELPFYTLVDGMQSVLQLQKTLKSKYIVPMANGDLRQSGLLANIIKTRGSIGEFQSILNDSSFNKCTLVPCTPCVDIDLKM